MQQNLCKMKEIPQHWVTNKISGKRKAMTSRQCLPQTCKSNILNAPLWIFWKVLQPSNIWHHQWRVHTKICRGVKPDNSRSVCCLHTAAVFIGSVAVSDLPLQIHLLSAANQWIWWEVPTGQYLSVRSVVIDTDGCFHTDDKTLRSIWLVNGDPARKEVWASDFREGVDRFSKILWSLSKCQSNSLNHRVKCNREVLILHMRWSRIKRLIVSPDCSNPPPGESWIH